ncbi:MAG TPA: hypothetical protein VM581_00950 [Magnetospirillaceae bacterium]|nr:hypothetical protein [Magnetospirillaceae bacterium]
MHKALLLDADGVTILAPQPYSFTYAEQQGLNPASIEPFFKGPFQEALRGKANLKELISQHHDTWKIDNPDQFLRDWFAAENVPAIAIQSIITECQSKGTPVFLATNQESYRTTYLREVMFPHVFNGMLVSCELGFTKNEPGFWQAALSEIAKSIPGIIPSEILYFDDSETYITSAAHAGIDARLFEGPHQIREVMGLA